MNVRKTLRASGFTLLEVLVALTLMSVTALVIVRAVGDGQLRLADTGWRDNAIRAGRGRLLEIVRQEERNRDSRGTLAPDFPDMEWSCRSIDVLGMPVTRLEFRIRSLRSPGREALLEYVFP